MIALVREFKTGVGILMSFLVSYCADLRIFVAASARGRKVQLFDL